MSQKIDQRVEQFVERMSYLYDRWQDEREYEDFNDYRDAMVKAVGVIRGKFVKAHKRPFGCTFVSEKGLSYRFKITSAHYQFKREG